LSFLLISLAHIPISRTSDTQPTMPVMRPPEGKKEFPAAYARKELHFYCCTVVFLLIF
jgi:hypothetical protein